MVLRQSDYNLRNLWSGNWDPTSNPSGFLRKATGTVIAATFAIFLFVLAVRRGVPLLNQIMGRLTGGRVTTEGQVRVF